MPALTILAICRSDLGLGQPVDKLKFLPRWSGADDEDWPNHKGEGPGRDRDASAAVIDRPLQRTAPRLGYRSLREFDAAHGRPRLCPAVRGLQQNSSTCPHGLPLTTGQKTRAYRQLLKADPEYKSDRQIAKVVKADNKTVASRRRRSEGREEFLTSPSRSRPGLSPL